jgi:integrase
MTPKQKSRVTLAQIADIEADTHIHPHIKAAILLGFYGLARCGELFNLTWGQVTIFNTHTTILLRSSKTDVFRKGSIIGVDAMTWSRIAHYTSPGEPNELLFPSATRAEVLRTLGGQGHSLRRGGAQYLWNCGFSLEAIKRRGRWSSDAWQCYIETTARDLTGYHNMW